MSIDITLLKEKQIWGITALQVMKRYGTEVGMSDLAVLLGSTVSKSNATTSDGQRSARVWSASSSEDGIVRAVHYHGGLDSTSPNQRLYGARPALPSSVASSLGLRKAKPSRKISRVDVVEYGEYPQTIAPENIGNELESAFFDQKLTATGKKYTFDAEKYDAYHNPFNAKEHAEYQHKGKKYIRVKAKPYGMGFSMLSNGEQAQAGQSYWVEVQPIEWLRDPSGICIARQAILGGVQLDRKRGYDGIFENTDMKQYLQNYFAKEMVAGRSVAAPAAIGPNTAAILSGREAQRQRALDDPSQGL